MIREDLMYSSKLVGVVKMADETGTSYMTGRKGICKSLCTFMSVYSTTVCTCDNECMCV